MARALLMPAAQSSTLKPGGTLILSTGMSAAALGAGGCGMGARVESAMFDGCPCFHVGGGCCACWAETHGTSARATMKAEATSEMKNRMVNLLFEDRRHPALRTIRLCKSRSQAKES